MTRTRFWFAAAVFAVGAGFLSVAHSQPQPAKKALPKPEPVAETKLLMEGMADPNTKALGKLLAASLSVVLACSASVPPAAERLNVLEPRSSVEPARTVRFAAVAAELS